MTRALEIDPDRRFQSSAEFSAAIAPHLASGGAGELATRVACYSAKSCARSKSASPARSPNRSARNRAPAPAHELPGAPVRSYPCGMKDTVSLADVARVTVDDFRKGREAVIGVPLARELATAVELALLTAVRAERRRAPPNAPGAPSSGSGPGIAQVRRAHPPGSGSPRQRGALSLRSHRHAIRNVSGARV